MQKLPVLIGLNAMAVALTVLTFIAAIDAYSFYSRVWGKSSGDIWYSQNWLAQPYTNARFFFAEKQDSISPLTGNLIREVKIGQVVFWTRLATKKELA